MRGPNSLATTYAFASLLALGSFACRQRAANRAPGVAPSASHEARPAPLTRLATGNLFDAYAGGGADAQFRGKRYTLFGNFVAASVDAGAQQVVLGSKLQPVVATGIAPEAALALVPDSAIEIDCTVTGSTAEIPQVDCGPNGVPRPVSPPP